MVMEFEVEVMLVALVVVPLLRTRPSGRAPTATFQVYGAVVAGVAVTVIGVIAPPLFRTPSVVGLITKVFPTGGLITMLTL